jgi:flagellin
MAQRQLGQATEGIGRSFTRLSSGMRINSASDDAAGLSVASSLQFSTRVHGQAIRNLNDGVSVLTIASETLASLGGVINRQLELAEQSANGTFSRNQRLTMQAESDSLTAEFNRILNSTSFNGINLLKNSTDLRLQAGYGDSSFLDFALGSKIKSSKSTGSYSVLSSASIAVGAQETVAADLNGDGNLDLIAATNTGSAVLRYGNGDGTFGATTTITTGGSRYIAIDDINGDGRMDIIHGTSGGFTATLQTSSGFAAAVSYTGNASFVNGRNGTLADVNGDGRVDLIQSYTGASQGVEIFLNNGDGTFYSSATFSATSVNGTPSVGDLNGDGKLDFIVAGNFSGGGNNAYVFYGNGNGSFQAPQTLGFSAGTNVALIADFDNDGLLDVGQVNGAGGLQVRRGNGNGTFKAIQTTTDIGGNVITGIRTADLNKDGFADIIGSVFSDGRIVTYFGNGDGTFRASQSSSTTGVGTLGSAIGDFNGDGVEDIAVSGGGTTSLYLSNTTQNSEIGLQYLVTQAGARSSLETLRAIAERIQSETSQIGASLSRIQVGLNTLATRRENELASYSRIMDVDVAEESSVLIRQQILQKAAASVLGQANQEPQLALSLLRS